MGKTTVEDLLGRFDDVAVSIDTETAAHIFDREDVDFIPEELLNMEVKEFNYFPRDLKRRCPLLVINV